MHPSQLPGSLTCHGLTRRLWWKLNPQSQAAEYKFSPLPAMCLALEQRRLQEPLITTLSKATMAKGHRLEMRPGSGLAGEPPSPMCEPPVHSQALASHVQQLLHPPDLPTRLFHRAWTAPRGRKTTARAKSPGAERTEILEVLTQARKWQGESWAPGAQETLAQGPVPSTQVNVCPPEVLMRRRQRRYCLRTRCRVITPEQWLGLAPRPSTRYQGQTSRLLYLTLSVLTFSTPPQPQTLSGLSTL